MDDKFHDRCGIFGIFNHRDAVKLTRYGLFALQHRGQESAGIVSSNGTKLFQAIHMGLVSEALSDEHLKGLQGSSAIGHVRYSTSGISSIKEAQPIMVKCSKGRIGIAHNGNIRNYKEIKDMLWKAGSIFTSTADSEIILHLMARSRRQNLIEALVDSLINLQGAYSLVILTPRRLIGVRDPWGVRPLSLGILDNSYVLSSETDAFDLIGAKFERDIEPGEIVSIGYKGIESFYPFRDVKPAQCIFELIYFARPDSTIFGRNVHNTRMEFGKRLAIEYPTEQADIVVPVPDSGMSAALGYAIQSKKPFELAIVRNHYVGRTFISPEEVVRHLKVKQKLNPIKDILKGKSIVLVDDSIVRGNTSRILVDHLRQAGAKEIHFRISSPPIVSPCYYGIDTPTEEELLASYRSVKEIKEYLNVDSLGYLSLEGMLKTVGSNPKGEFCTGCFDKLYRVEKAREKKINILDASEIE